MAEDFNQTVGRQLRQLRDAEGLRQDQLAERMRRLFGIPWTRDTVAAIETKGRPLSFVEAIGIAHVLGSELRRVDSFGGVGALFDSLAEGEWLAVSEVGEVTVAGIRAALVGNPKGLQVVRTPWTSDALLRADETKRALQVLGETLGHRPKADVQRAYLTAVQGAAERKTAAHLHTTPSRVAALAIRLWGQGLTEEREARLAAKSLPDDPKAVNTIRGHITRQLRQDIRQALADQEDQT